MLAAARGALASAVVGLLAAGLLLAGARWWLPATIRGPIAEGAWTARSRALFTPTGFFRPEYDPATERHYSWAGGTAALEFSQLDRSVAYLVTLELRGSRPPGIPRPDLRIAVDGRLCLLVSGVASETSRVQFEIPRREGVGAVVSFDVSPTYTPGAADPRALGLIVDDVAVRPVRGSFRPGWIVLLKAALAVMACAWGVWAAGLRGPLFAATALAVATGFVWLLLKDAAFAGTYVDRLLAVGFGGGGVAAAIGGIRARWPVIGGVPDWSVAAALVLSASVVKLALVWHPLAIVGDGLFQAHRAQLVHAGSYFFTSVTPRPFFEFPYPVALFVAAQPFWSFFPADLDLVRLLRALSLVADALVGVALYAAARRQWPESRAAFFAAVLWPFARAPFEALSNANLTNLFGQGLFGVALAGVAWMAASVATPRSALVLVTAFLTVALLSHFGTATVGLAMLGVVAAVLIASGTGYRRRLGLWVCAVTIAAAAVSWLVYYSDSTFHEVYTKTFASVATTAPDDSSKIVAAPAVKFRRWWSGVGDDYGRPGIVVLATALAGLLFAMRRRPFDGGALVFSAWILAWLALSALGVFTAFTLRANLAAAPAFILFCGVALGALANRSRAGTLAAAVLVVLIAWDGWQIGLRCLELSGTK